MKTLIDSIAAYNECDYSQLRTLTKKLFPKGHFHRNELAKLWLQIRVQNKKIKNLMRDISVPRIFLK